MAMMRGADPKRHPALAWSSSSPRCLVGWRGNHFCSLAKGHKNTPHRCVCGDHHSTDQGQVVIDPALIS